MAPIYKILFILTLLFLAAHAKKEKKHKHHKVKLHKLPKFHKFADLPEPNPLTQDPAQGDQAAAANDDFPKIDEDQQQPPIGNLAQGDNNDDIINVGADVGNVIDPKEEVQKPDFETMDNGNWELVSQESGVSAMHINLLPNNKIYVYDAISFHISRINLPPGQPCLQYNDEAQQPPQPNQDCWAHSVEYDTETNTVRPLTVARDPWCSSGGLSPDGTLVTTGGFLDGGKAVRYIEGCPTCDWREYPDTLLDPRWYATQAILPNGNFIVVGGRGVFSYEYLAREGRVTDKPYYFPFLYETSDVDENNLYPFVHLSTDGNLFIFSNNRSLLLNPTTNRIVRTFPVLPGGSRNYPASGMSALLPINLNAAVDANGAIPAEVMVCGGNAPNAFNLAETKKVFLPALNDCNRMIITDPNPKWENELMPSRRTMGDLLILPNGQLLFINGAELGTAAWWDADAPNFTPVLYSPEKPNGLRFRPLKPSQIARMYHSTSAVLASGKIWVGGSNTHDTYKAQDRFPTETRIENFSPPYLAPELDEFRPQIVQETSANQFMYGQTFETTFTLMDTATPLTKNDIKVHIYFPPFTTHGFSMSQRMVVLKTDNLSMELPGIYKVMSVAPPSGVIAPPGYYLLFVVHRGVPSKGMWVQIQ